MPAPVTPPSSGHRLEPSCRSRSRRLAGLCLGILGLVTLLALGQARAQPGFEEVAAIFDERCVMCHSGASAPLGLRLDSYDNVMRGSESRPVVVPGDPEGSELVRRVRGTSLPRMPLTGPPFLSDAEIELIVQWIAASAPPPADNARPGEAEAAAQKAATPPPAPGEPVTFEHVESIFMQRCVVCHSDNGIMDGPPEELRLDGYENVVHGGERVVVVPGAPLASELYRRITGRAQPRMPLNGPPFLSEAEIRLIRDWIAQGAAGADGRPAQLVVGGEVRLHGILTERWALDGLALRVTPATRLDDNPMPGSYVEVRGIIDPDGVIRATRIKPR